MDCCLRQSAKVPGEGSQWSLLVQSCSRPALNLSVQSFLREVSSPPISSISLLFPHAIPLYLLPHAIPLYR